MPRAPVWLLAFEGDERGYGNLRLAQAIRTEIKKQEQLEALKREMELYGTDDVEEEEEEGGGGDDDDDD